MPKLDAAVMEARPISFPGLRLTLETLWYCSECKALAIDELKKKNVCKTCEKPLKLFGSAYNVELYK